MKQHRVLAAMALFTATVIWSLPAVFVKYLEPYFSVVTLNFFRFLSPAILLWIISLLCFRRQLKDGIKCVGWLILAAVLSFLFQVLWVVSIYEGLFPTVAVLLSKSSTIFSGVFAFIFFADERRRIKSPKFLLGATLALIGVCGVIIAKDPRFGGTALGVALVIIAHVFWSAYELAIKVAVRRVNPIIAFAFVATMVTSFFGVAVYLVGDISEIYRAPPLIIVVLVGSGILCLGVAHTLYYFSIQQLGMVVCAVALLITPLITGVVSYFLFGELLTPIQCVSGAILMGGLLLATIRRRNSATP